MKSVKKFSILTSIILAFSIVFSATLLSSAEDNGSNEYGTNEAGITLSDANDTVAMIKST